MKENIPSLYANAEVGAKVIDYSVSRSSALPAPLLAYHARILKLEKADMSISTFQGQAMSFFAKLAGVKRVLEIGVFRGFSSLVWSHAVGPSGIVTGLEFSPEYAEEAREAFAEHGVKNVNVIVGDGLETLATLEPDEPYDLIFIDAQKIGYPIYLKTILGKSSSGVSKRLLRSGGLILADNVLRGGLVADPSPDNPKATRMPVGNGGPYGGNVDLIALDEFNTALSKEKRIDTLILPLFDGLALARLLD